MSDGELPDVSISTKSTRVLNNLKEISEASLAETLFDSGGGKSPVQVCCTRVPRLLASADVHAQTRFDLPVFLEHLQII
jgi:hypothetical protein